MGKPGPRPRMKCEISCPCTRAYELHPSAASPARWLLGGTAAALFRGTQPSRSTRSRHSQRPPRTRTACPAGAVYTLVQVTSRAISCIWTSAECFTNIVSYTLMILRAQRDSSRGAQGGQITGPWSLGRVTAPEHWAEIQRLGSQLTSGSTCCLGQALSPLGPASIPSPVLSGFQAGHPVNPSRDGELHQPESFSCVQPKSAFLNLISSVPPLPPGAGWKTYYPISLWQASQNLEKMTRRHPFLLF